jgi:hypothetical protein
LPANAARREMRIRIIAGLAAAAAALAVALPAGASASTSVPYLPAEGLDFGPVKLGTTSDTQVLTVVSPPCTQDAPGHCALVPAVVPPPPQIAGDFQLTDDSCAESILIGPEGDECYLFVAFTPARLGRQPGSLTYSIPSGTFVVPLTGIGVPAVNRRRCKTLKRKIQRKRCRFKRRRGTRR